MANNNGMHFIRHNQYGKYEDLSYYDRHSAEGIANRRYEAMACFESIGEYEFTKYAANIKILLPNKEYEHITIYKLFVYELEYENKLHAVSSKKEMRKAYGASGQYIEVRVHDNELVIYMSQDVYKQYLNEITIKDVYKLMNTKRKSS